MKQYKYILFDLDGTLTDPAEGITNSVIYALKRFGIPAPARETLYPFIGPPLTDSFERFYGFTKAQARQAVDYYRIYFTDKGIFENVLYPGTVSMLQRLSDCGKTLIMATSKPEVFAERIAAHFGIAQYFTYIAGSLLDGTRVKKNEVIRFALSACGIADGTRAVMVGDREHDILGAKSEGLDAVGVLYGYGSREELLLAGADALAATPEEAADLLALRE